MPQYREWTPTELEQLRTGVGLYTTNGRTCWTSVVRMVTSRTMRQCQDRYLNRMKGRDHDVTKTDSHHASWTTDETELLNSLVQQHGHRWSDFAVHFPNRDANKIKSKYYNQRR